MKLWLDNEREAPEGWICEKDPWAVIDMLTSGKVTDISLDHNFGAEITGYTVLASLENMVVGNMIEKVPKIEIHAANPVDLERMEQAVKSIRKLEKAHKLKRTHKLDFWKRQL